VKQHRRGVIGIGHGPSTKQHYLDEALEAAATPTAQKRPK
jgi:hypothetical protein